MKKIPIIGICLFLGLAGMGQHPGGLSYYLPDNISYNPDIPKPADILGYEIGEWHVSPDQIRIYLTELSRVSDRMVMETYATSAEARPLLLLTITSKKNHQQLDKIRAEHLALSDPARSASLDVKKMPLVVYLGFSVHGNEPSGANASLALAYYLGAAQGNAIDSLLDQCIILLDPCLNPDGLNRHATWANMHRSKNPVADKYHREHQEGWPSGRTNHYWFDLNRDWLPAQHPESQGRLIKFREWQPNVLTDHHEMGTNATYFFQPGVPSRNNPLTPARNTELTKQMAAFHARALDKIGSLYYSEESFDDFYYGKGSTYPDINGAIGILFEQAGAGGQIQESDHGPLSFPFTIKNQLTTALSTLEGGLALKNELLSYQQEFYRDARVLAGKDPVKAYVFKADIARTAHFLELVQLHGIKAYRLARDLSIRGQDFPGDQSWIIPVEQQQYRLINAIFETRTTFTDSLFYDVSSWTIPLAFDLDFQEVDAKTFSKDLLGSPVEASFAKAGKLIGAKSDIAYVLPWDDFYAPKALYRLLDAGLKAKVATREFTLSSGNRPFKPGTILVGVQNQEDFTAETIHKILREIVADCPVRFYAVESALTPLGIDLGSPSLRPVEKPEMLLLVGRGIATYTAGHLWHMLDERFDMKVVLADVSNVKHLDWERYNTIFLPGGSYGSLGKEHIGRLKEWVSKGGRLIAIKEAVRWISKNDLGQVSLLKSEPDTPAVKRLPYGSLHRSRGAKRIGGAIFATILDLTHPLCYGYKDPDLPVFKQGSLMLDLTKNAYASPVIYKDQPLISGYAADVHMDKLGGSAAVVVSGIGKGKVICLADDPAFRGFWYGTNRLLLNAVFFSPIIDHAAVEKVKKEKKGK